MAVGGGHVIMIRPEQARALIALQAEAEHAEAVKNAALGVVLAGIVPAGTAVLEVRPNGEVVVATGS